MTRLRRVGTAAGEVEKLRLEAFEPSTRLELTRWTGRFRRDLAAWPRPPKRRPEASPGRNRAVPAAATAGSLCFWRANNNVNRQDPGNANREREQ